MTLSPISLDLRWEKVAKISLWEISRSVMAIGLLIVCAVLLVMTTPTHESKQ